MANDSYNIPTQFQANEQVDLHAASSNVISLEEARARRSVNETFAPIPEIGLTPEQALAHTAAELTLKVYKLRHDKLDGQLDIAV